MKILKSTLRNKGYGLILALTFVLIMLTLLATTMNWSSSDSKVTNRNNQFVNSQYAAEAAVENAVGQVNFDFLFGSLTNASGYESAPTNIGDWPVQYIFSSPYVTNSSNTNIYVYIGGTSADAADLPAPYTGLKGFYQECDFAATATPIGQRYGVPATVHETLWATQIPIFQYVIFYNIDMEIDPGASMPINGNVFCNAQPTSSDPNAGAWLGTANAVFHGLVWAVGTNDVGSTDNFAKSKTDSSTPNFPTIGGVKQPVSGVTPVTIPVAGVNNTNNDPAVVHKILEWPPTSYALGSADAYTTNGLTYLANEAGLIISNSIFGTNWDGFTPHTNFMSVYYQDATYQSSALNSNPLNWTNSIIWVTNDFYRITVFTNGHQKLNYPASTNYVAASGTNTTTHWSTNIIYAGYSFLTNVLFYDWREGWVSGKAKTVQAVQFNVGNFDHWLSSTKANGGSYYNTLSKNHWHHSIGGVYMYTSVTNTTTNLPAVRVVNGAQLYDSYGLTIATQFPLYVQADYNTTDGSGSDAGKNSTGNTYPSAFLADSVTVLSSSFNDTTNQMPTPSSVNTVNAACLEGIVPSSKTVTAKDDASGYSGGVENFLRLLENWSGKTLYYNGSIVVMFPSEYATNRWRTTGNYYNAPTRDWAFDTNFNTQVKMPPMTPNVKSVIRVSWSGN